MAISGVLQCTTRFVCAIPVRYKRTEACEHRLHNKPLVVLLKLSFSFVPCYKSLCTDAENLTDRFYFDMNSMAFKCTGNFPWYIGGFPGFSGI